MPYEDELEGENPFNGTNGTNATQARLLQSLDANGTNATADVAGEWVCVPHASNATNFSGVQDGCNRTANRCPCPLCVNGTFPNGTNCTRPLPKVAPRTWPKNVTQVCNCTNVTKNGTRATTTEDY